MIKIAVCDDIPYAAEMVKELLLSHDFGEELEIDCFESGAELYNQFMINRYNIFMTDIELTPDGYSKTECYLRTKSRICFLKFW